MYENQYKMYLIDYGLAKVFMKGDKPTCKHIEFCENKERAVGTLKYMSVAANSDQEQGRKDDLESFGYFLAYLSKRKLPWSNSDLNLTRKENYERCMEIKKSTEAEVSQIIGVSVQYIHCIEQLSLQFYTILFLIPSSIDSYMHWLSLDILSWIPLSLLVWEFSFHYITVFLQTSALIA